MGFLDKLLTAGAAVGLGALVGALFVDAQETQRRKNSPLHFDDGLTQRGFIELALDTGKRTPRVEDVVVTGMTVTLRVKSNSGLSTWNAQIDFNDYGRLTGKYWLNQENAKSIIPKHFADVMNAEIERRVGSAASRPAQEPLRTQAPPRTQAPRATGMSQTESFRSAPGWVAPTATRGYGPANKSSVALVTVAWVVAICTGGYMLPWAIAVSRGKSNISGVGQVNLLTGWTFIGWIVALVMACGSHEVTQVPWVQQQPTPQGPPPPGFYWSPNGSGGQAYWNGQVWTFPYS